MKNTRPAQRRAATSKTNLAAEELAMNMPEAMSPVFQTERLDIFRMRCVRNPAIGLPRDVYVAFHRDQDIARPVCVCTIWPDCPLGPPYVEWLEVTSREQRSGIASEVLLGLQDHIGPMIAEPVTHGGELLLHALADRLVQPEEVELKSPASINVEHGAAE